MYFNWFGRLEKVDPTMLHIFIEAVVTRHGYEEGVELKLEYQFSFIMAIRGKNHDEEEWHDPTLETVDKDGSSLVCREETEGDPF